jgi:hypothetical protein
MQAPACRRLLGGRRPNLAVNEVGERGVLS